MLKNRQKACTLLLAGMFLLIPIIRAAAEQSILSAEEYDKQFQVYLETHVVTPELLSTWEDGLIQYPENNQLRYYLVLAYANEGQNEKVKVYTKEALQYEPDNKFFAHTYLMFSAQGKALDKTLEAAKYMLEITLPSLPPVGQFVNQNEIQDVNDYIYLRYCMDAAYIMQSIYTERNDEENMLHYSDWILQRKDDSDLGYEYSLISMYVLAIYYGREGRFIEMEYWLDQYFALESTASVRGDNWLQIQERLRPFTNILQEIHNAYLKEGDEMDISAILEHLSSQ